MRLRYHTSPDKHSPLPVWLRLIAAVTILAILLLPGGPALAHANLVRSDPAVGAALSQAPQVIVLEFSEDLDPGFSSVQLLNSSGQVVVGGPGQIDPAQPKTMQLKVPGLADGVYSAIWKARSTVDGHVTTGTVGFSVGAAAPRVSILPPPGTPDPATALPQPLDSLARWLAYIMAAVALGGPLFGLLVWRPAVRRDGEGYPEAGAFITYWSKRLSLIGIAGLLIATLGLMLIQAGQASGRPFLDLFGAPLVTFLTTRTGLLLIIRLGLLAALALTVWWLPPIDAGRGGLWWLAALIGVGLLATFSLQSHGAASGQPVGPVILDTFHLLAMSAWVGGLLPLALLLRAARRDGLSLPPLPALIPRFSVVALVSVNTLAITGLFSAITQVQTLDALTVTAYGQTLVVKTGLVAVLLVLGAANLLILTPRLTRAPGETGRDLRRTTGAELAVGLLVLLAAGVLTSLQPAATALDASRRLGFIGSADAGSVRLTLRVAPARVGDAEFGVDVVDNRPGASTVNPQVVLRLSLLGRDLGITQLETARASGDRFTARGTYIVLPGQWQVEVILRRPGFDDIVHRFIVPVEGALASSAPQEDTTPNPVQPDASSAAAGKALYQVNCVPCHGASGKGDGPVGLTLNPRPADLTIHTAPGVHPDGQLYKWITDGYPGSTMPAFSQYLTDTDRWNLVNYIRTLSPQK